MAYPRRPGAPFLLLVACFLVPLVAGACRSRTPGTSEPGVARQPAAQQPAQSPDKGAQGVSQSPSAPQPPSAPARENTVERAGVAPTITTPPEDLVIIETAPSSLKVTARGTPPLTYRWTKQGRPALLSSDAEFWIANPSLDDSGIYEVEVSNEFGRATATCRLTVNPRPR